MENPFEPQPFVNPFEPSAPEPAPEPELDTVESLRDKMTEIIKEFGGESRVPYHHDYWKIRNRFRAALKLHK